MRTLADYAVFLFSCATVCTMALVVLGGLTGLIDSFYWAKYLMGSLAMLAVSIVLSIATDQIS